MSLVAWKQSLGKEGHPGGRGQSWLAQYNQSSPPPCSLPPPASLPNPSPQSPSPLQVGRMLGDIRHALSAAEVDKVVERTGGYSGSDMRNFIQEACQV